MYSTTHGVEGFYAINIITWKHWQRSTIGVLRHAILFHLHKEGYKEMHSDLGDKTSHVYCKIHVSTVIKIFQFF